MAEKKTTKRAATASGKGTSASGSKFSAEERAAMKERAKELKAAKTREAGERALLEKIAEMPPPDRSIAERIHAIVSKNAPDLWPKTWYGMPAYAKDDKVVCSFTPASKFNSRYSTFGFNDDANLDQGVMWPTSWALVRLTPAEERKIAGLVKKAAR